MPLGSAEINLSCEIVLTGFILFAVSLFVIVLLTAQYKTWLRPLWADASRPGALPSIVKRRLQKLRRKEVVRAALEFDSDARIKKKAHTRKGKVKDKKDSSAVFCSVCNVA